MREAFGRLSRYRDPAGAALGRLRHHGRHARSWLVRRLRLLPAGTPDGLGEDEYLARTGLDADVIVYFADTPDALYQLAQWYPALRALDRVHRTTILVQDSQVAARVRRESCLPVVTVVRPDTLAGVLRRSRVRVALYVNHSQRNFRLLRFCSLAHVSLLHGDSDKTISVSNQTKAYDFVFVAGRAAVDRASRNLPLFDTGRMLAVGRPTLDAEALERGPRAAARAEQAERAGDRRPTVLYAPTWEGAQVTASYSSVASHGEAVVRALLRERYRVIYRPHPLTGVRLAEVGEADRRIREMLADADAADPGARHRVDLEVSVSESMADADLLICDVSAMSVEWLPSGRPLIITTPADDRVAVAGTALERVAPRLGVADLDTVAELVRRELTEDPSRQRRRELIEYYVGDTAPGAAVAAFVGAVDEVARRRDEEWARVVAGTSRPAHG